ncbi:MAG: hypothetical protein SFV15_19165 [Polyangiaceae bacterium]|nr:hypothetical protein [Polyangiaceae bacterium]
MPRTAVHWLSTLCVWLVLAIFLHGWLKGHWETLTNPDLQQDDARSAIFQYHRWEPGGALKDDPISNEMLTYQPPFVRGLYFVFVKATNVFVATKLVQLVCLLIIVGAAGVLFRAKRLGLLGASLLLFLFFRDWWVMNRIAGGLPRAFAFPCFALWFSGALSAKGGVRRLAALLAALTYPTALAMILPAEGIFVMANRFGQSRAHVVSGLKHYAVTVLMAILAVSPSLLGGPAKDGPLYSLEDAKQEPAFGKSGRLWILPFDEPRHVFGWEFAATFMPQGKRPLGEEPRPFDEHLPRFAFVLIAGLGALSVMGLSARPMPTVSFCCGCAVMYFVACYWAFRLYSPERFYSFGIHAVGLMLVVDVLATFGERFRDRIRYPLRNFVGAAAMGGMWLFLGTGYAPQLSGTNLNRSVNRPLNDFVAGLPLNARIAGHPLDSDDIPLWAARATMGGFETLQPWLKGSWARQKARTEDTFLALYATERSTVLDYAKRNQVTHFLINRNRYGTDFVSKARTFEPFNTFTNRTLSGISYQSLVFLQVPEEAVLFTYSRFQLVSVERLAKAWASPPEGS